MIRCCRPLFADAPLVLLCHPLRPDAVVRRIEVTARFADSGALALSYRVHGDPAALCLPAPLPPAPADGLWQHTCCEAFLAAVDAAAYREFNFSPAGTWANYAFSAYRQRDPDFVAGAVPQISFFRRVDGFQLDALLPPSLLPAAEVLQIGLTTVVEALDGSKSYWALAHAAAQPDFHLRQSFTLTLKVPQP